MGAVSSRLLVVIATRWPSLPREMCIAGASMVSVRSATEIMTTSAFPRRSSSSPPTNLLLVFKSVLEVNTALVWLVSVCKHVLSYDSLLLW